MNQTEQRHAFIEWAKTAGAGDEFVYASDKAHLMRCYKGEHVKTKIAKTAWEMYERGIVRLMQRKRHDDHYDYVAVRRGGA